jgi:hypothetical protein
VTLKVEDLKDEKEQAEIENNVTSSQRHIHTYKNYYRRTGLEPVLAKPLNFKDKENIPQAFRQKT